MRLLVFSHYFWPEDFRINELTAELSARGHDVTVVTGQPNYPSGRLDPDYARDPSRYASFHGARIVRVPVIRRGTTLRLILNYLSYAAAASFDVVWRRRRERYDAVFVFAPSPFTVVVPALVYRALTRRPVALWVLDQWPETLVAVGVLRPGWAERLVGGFVRRAYARCEAILAQSPGLVPVIARYAPPGHRIEYFPNWSEPVAGRRDAPAPEVPAAPGVFTVMFAGNIGVAQDLPAVLAAAARLAHRDDIRWVIVGDGRAADDARAEARRLGVERRVHFVGRHPAARMPAFFACADALLVSLRPDPVFALTVPGKVQSYLMAGKPIVGMLDGEGAAVIRAAEAGFAGPAGDAAALAANVERVAALAPSEREAMGARGRTFAEREFDRDTLVGRLDALLRGLAESRP